MSSVIRTLLEFAQSWAGGDRIRIPPTEGRLLGLQSGDRLLVKNEVYQICSQIIDEDRIVYRLIVYQITGVDLRGELHVPTKHDSRSDYRGTKSGKLFCDNRIVDVFDDDVVVLSEIDSATNEFAEKIDSEDSRRRGDLDC